MSREREKEACDEVSELRAGHRHNVGCFSVSISKNRTGSPFEPVGSTIWPDFVRF